ncbi:hypothetical protein BG011_003781 [Mortierella polycephala]|uniref:ADP-ribosylglycohydrolase n=1 Tax=Mortierella polycephala TaxID=41804 RepID=A0A9P6Q3K3_9FUNG|nr:hypothetical protein BG011_003781 [Mortierella polycephala]
MAELSTLTKLQLRDRIRGCILGNALGDAYGLATEFMTAKQAEQRYGNGPIAFGRDSGYPVWEDPHRAFEQRNDFTDDTDQLLVLLQSLEQTGNGKLCARNFANRLIEWRNYGIPEIGTEPGRGLGYTVSRVMEHPAFLLNPHRAAFEVWDSEERNLAPNGATMRTGVIGVETFWDEPRVVENAMAAAKVTHVDPRSVVSAVISSVLISRLLRGGGEDKAEDMARTWNPKLTQPDYRQELLAYLERGTTLKGNSSLNPTYEPDTEANRFRRKDYVACATQLAAKDAESGAPKPVKDQNPSQWNKGRPDVTHRPSIGWAGIDQVGDDEAMAPLARSVFNDYKFLLQQTDVVPIDTSSPERVQERWANAMETMCFPPSLHSLELGCGRAMGYTFKCIGIAYYGATRRLDLSPTLPEYHGPAGLFRGLMEQVTLEAGDADTNCAVMGSLLGARFGLENGLPSTWWEELQHLEWLNTTLDKYIEHVMTNYDVQCSAE